MKKKRFSVPRIRDPRYPHIQVRIVALAGSPFLFLGRQKDGKPTYTVIHDEKTGRKYTPASLGDTKKEREDKARALGLDAIKKIAEEEVAPPKQSDDGRLTLSQLAERYERDGFADRTAGYRRDSLAALRRIAAVLGAEKVISDLWPADVQRYVAARHAEGVTAAARGDVVALKIACNWAVENGNGLEVSPFTKAGFKKVMPAKPKPKQPVARKDRYEKLKAVAGQLPPMFAVLLDVAWHMGKRIGAIRRLQWQDVMLEADEKPHGASPLEVQYLRSHTRR